jgi:RHS repeat-associated protein
VLDQEGKVTASFDYDPYGRLINSPAKQPEFGYAGMQYHAQSGLYLTKYRVYEPGTGRWLSRDPIGEKGGINLYGYVLGNPVKWTDTSGLNPAAAGCAVGSPGGPPGCIAGAVIATVATGVMLACIAHSDSTPEEPVSPPDEPAAPDPDTPPVPSVPELPTDLTGENPVQGSGNRINTDLPGNSRGIFDSLGGGRATTLPNGHQVAPNNVRFRPGNETTGPRIDIPAHGSRPHETIHFPPGG